MQRCPLWGLLLILHGRAGLATESFLTRRKEAHLLRSADEPEASLVLPHAADIWNAAASYAARANAAATEARAAEHQTHAGVAANAAKKPSATAVTDADDMKKFPGMVEDQRAKTKEWAALSVESLQKAEAMVDETRAKAYETAKQAAKAKVAKLEQGAHAYYQELLDQLAALASPQKDPRAEAAAAAAKPYFEVELRVLAMVLNYNLKAQELMAAAKATVTLGHTLAGKANIQQTGGNAEMAMRLMIQAHDCMVQAQLKEDQAKKIYKLARSLNASVPTYQTAAQQAAAHVLATFSGIQVHNTPSLRGFSDGGIAGLRNAIAKLEA
eukprot:GEMP01076918.1.p1 GENE.GEMP01076918.1~~GEMP01076918.1.p1  ORF type:complete len:327 (+),score=101.28 GEMP01076918.1:65-1045(+)